MKFKKKTACLFFIFSLSAELFADESLTTLLAGYFRNNLTLQNLAAEVEKQILSDKSEKISNGFSINLSSGTVVYKTGAQNTLTFSPSASLEIPQLNGLTLSASSDIDLFSTEKQISDTSLSLGIDIYSSTRELKQISLLKSQRAVLEAQRNLQNGFLTVEKEFYSSLKSLYKTAISIVQAEEDLYEDKIDFEEIKAKGYNTSSVKYRSAQMKVLSDEHTVETAKRELEREVKIFASKCGVKYDATDALEFLPKEIPETTAVNILDLSKENFSEIESAVWTHKINSLTRKAEKSVSVKGSAGYTFDNENTGSDTIDAGTSFTLMDTGLSVNAGVSLPVAAENATPAYTFGFSIDPNAFRQHSITSKVNKLSEEQENISIRSAENEYDTSVVTQQSSLEDILWSTETNSESYKMYTELEKDMAAYFERGIITESEYLSAKANKENYRLQCLIDTLNLIIYNDETQLLFCRDSELSENETDKENAK